AYGNDYSRYANCLVAANFASAAPTILAPGASPTCFNTPTANAVRANLVSQFNAAVLGGNIPLATAIAGNISTLSAFARLNNSTGPGLARDFSLPGFGNNGFANIMTALGVPGLTL